MENRPFQILLTGGQFANIYKIIHESVSFNPVTSLLGMIKVEHCFYVTQCPLSREWLNAPWPIYTTEYHVAVKHEKRYSRHSNSENSNVYVYICIHLFYKEKKYQSVFFAYISIRKHKDTFLYNEHKWRKRQRGMA